MERYVMANSCPSCEADIQPDWRVCPSCGERLPEKSCCISCLKELEHAWKACPYCGVKVGGDFTPEMVVIPAGEFIMGSPEEEEAREDCEGPCHRVEISASFALGKYAVTYQEFDHFTREGRFFHRPDDYGLGRGLRPVVNVNWGMAMDYCRWLSGVTEENYRLPSEAEWEYACRAGTTTPFHFGDTIWTDQANYNGSFVYGNGRVGKRSGPPVEVGTFPENAFGLHEMHGNVFEWCADVRHDDYTGAPSDGSAWTSKGDSESHITRGGWSSSEPWKLRSASRDWSEPNTQGNFIGFRVAKTL